MFYTLDIENVFMNLFNHAYGIPKKPKTKITTNITRKTASKYKNRLGNKTPLKTKDSRKPRIVSKNGATTGFSTLNAFNLSSQDSSLFF